VFLLMKKYEDAARLYKSAVAMARAEIANHQSTWTQARRLMEKLDPLPEERASIRSAFAHLKET